jgi:hypothetical protein
MIFINLCLKLTFVVTRLQHVKLTLYLEKRFSSFVLREAVVDVGQVAQGGAPRNEVLLEHEVVGGVKGSCVVQFFGFRQGERVEHELRPVHQVHLLHQFRRVDRRREQPPVFRVVIDAVVACIKKVMKIID